MHHCAPRKKTQSVGRSEVFCGLGWLSLYCPSEIFPSLDPSPPSSPSLGDSEREGRKREGQGGLARLNYLKARQPRAEAAFSERGGQCALAVGTLLPAFGDDELGHKLARGIRLRVTMGPEIGHAYVGWLVCHFFLVSQ